MQCYINNTKHTTHSEYNANTINKYFKKLNSVAFSPQANYTDCATATCRRNLVPSFADRGVSRGPARRNRSRYSSFKYVLIYAHEAEWTPFQTHCYAENLVAPEIEPGTSEFAARNSDH
jgi:hypothetical protein